VAISSTFSTKLLRRGTAMLRMSETELSVEDHKNHNSDGASMLDEKVGLVKS